MMVSGRSLEAATALITGAFGAAVESLLRDPARAAVLAQNARRRVIDEFLGDRHLEHYGLLFQQLARDDSSRSSS